MYYILNETDHIVAADDALLTLCGVAHINELTSSLAKGDVNLDSCSQDFDISKTSLSSLLGKLTLVELASTEETLTPLAPIEEDDDTSLIDALLSDEIEEETSALEETPEEDEITLGDHLSLEDDLIEDEKETQEEVSTDTDEEEEALTLTDDLALENTPLEESVEESVEEELLLDDDALFDLVSDETPTDEVVSEETQAEEDNTPLDFGLKNEDTLDDNILFDTPKPEVDVSEIVINIDETSQKIGISSEDYANFLNEFIDTALGFEKDLQSNDESTSKNAVNTLTYLSKVLHLPQVGDIITDIGNSSDDTQRTLIESFYGTLARITTTQEPAVEEELEDSLDILDIEDTPEVSTEEIIEEVEDEEEEEKLELFDEVETEEAPLSIQPEKAKSENSFGTISLEGITPKHFDFQLEEAANDLSLPVELIEEFVHDFISQAHIETANMLKAYEDGDLDAIQKIGHLLKGASSNLRINPLSDTLYQIQFCEDASKLEPLIKDYWAHFLSFENQINVISN
ncbi:MAG TPA: hypothetical protein ENJ34_03055 [Epsilonproteobacteria bacterium]|nr:hypothetical protein [Campylobacterota bacterium]